MIWVNAKAVRLWRLLFLETQPMSGCLIAQVSVAIAMAEAIALMVV
jgi:hypothetical protein